MNGPHDMGGMQCYGPVIPEKGEPRAMAMTVGMGFAGQWNLDISRHAREKLPADFYLTKSYYQIWINGLQNLMLERGMVTESELETGKLEKPGIQVKRVLAPEETPAALAAGGPVERDPQADPQFAVGDAVRTLNMNPQGHTRLPRYVRNAVGEIGEIHGCHVYPDTNARGEGENPQWLYSVAFKATELFGKDADPDHVVMVDCWEPYLERA